MKLGIYLNSQHPASDDPARRLAETLEQVRLIRTLGFDSIWAGEHHVTPGFHFFPQLALLQRVAAGGRGNVDRHQRDAAAAAQSHRAGGGRRLHGRDHRRPLPAGRRAWLSARRNTPSTACRCRSASSRLTEASKSSGRLWTEERVTHQGRHWQFADASIRAAPVQQPQPPIIIGAQVDAAIARAATIGDGWLVVPIPTLDKLARADGALQGRARRPPSCRQASTSAGCIEVSCAADEDTAVPPRAHRS